MDQQDLYTHYNWQFLRRNEKYRSMYDKYTEALESDENQALAMLFDLHSTWGMRTFIDWRVEVPDFLPDFCFSPIFDLGIFSYEQLKGRENPIKDLTTINPSNPADSRFLLIAIDLEKLRLKDYDSFKKTVSEMQDAYHAQKNIPATRVTSDREHLDLILTTYDEHIKNPEMSDYELAKTLIDLYRTEDNPNPSQHATAVGENIKRTTQLIALAPNIFFDFSKSKKST